MEDAAERVHNRNLIRTQEHLSISVDNDRSNLDALNESQNPKIDSSNSKSTTDSDRIYSGLREDPRLQQSPVNQRRNCAKAVIKNSQKITEQKNEILSRTVYFRAINKLFKVVLYYFIVLFILKALVGADAAPAKQGSTAIGYLRGPGNGRRFGHGGSHWRRPDNQRRNLNKNCKEYDITSRAFSADLIFEGKARSKRELGQYITFGIHKILKLRKTAFKPKTQIRLHFGGRRTADVSRSSLFNECLSRSIPSSDIVDTRWKLKFGTNYFVFADLSGPMNYTANGDPVVANKRNLKSIRSVIAKDREKPPRVRGLQDQDLKTSNELRLTCRIKGTPVPRINWYKDGVPLIPTTHVNVTYYRRNSTIEIKSLEMEDRGSYECRATTVTGKTANMSAYVNVSEIYTRTTTDLDRRFRNVKCLVDSYCLNGGKCEFIEVLGEHMCRCKAGFVGARCESKEISANGTKSYVCGFNVGYSSYYC